MDSYKIEWKKSALKELYKLPRNHIVRVMATIENLGSDPFSSRVKKLTGSERTYRLKVGSYRVIYEVEKDRLVIYILRVRHRKEAYR